MRRTLINKNECEWVSRDQTGSRVECSAKPVATVRKFERNYRVCDECKYDATQLGYVVLTPEEAVIIEVLES